jgi:hypothetical protein
MISIRQKAKMMEHQRKRIELLEKQLACHRRTSDRRADVIRQLRNQVERLQVNNDILLKQIKRLIGKIKEVMP